MPIDIDPSFNKPSIPNAAKFSSYVGLSL